jgi:thiamine-phosphate pyrophosphorylase
MNAGILRILDANCNRAREALRVLEDVARFALDDPLLQRSLKAARHDLAAATAAFLSDAIACRDTAGDVGTAASTPAERHRADLAHVATAAAKRLGESLRAIEECLKTLDPAAAGRVERVRYAFYDAERSLLLALRPRGRFASVKLYVLITESLCSRPWLEAAEAAIDGGADCLQLREKSLDGGELLARARALVALCRRRGVLSIVNDRVDVAIAAGADGVHVGQGDLPALEVRALVGDALLVGVSTHSLEQAQQARRDGADYVGIGPMYRSATKPRDFVVGPDGAREIASRVALPTVAIAGITRDNAAAVLASGVQAVAVTQAVVGAPDIAAAARELKAIVERHANDDASGSVQAGRATDRPSP